mgnify:CR=1 FL=1
MTVVSFVARFLLTVQEFHRQGQLLRLAAKTVILSLSKDDGFAEPAPFDGSTELAEVRLRVLGAFCWRRFRYQAEQLPPINVSRS